MILYVVIFFLFCTTCWVVASSDPVCDRFAVLHDGSTTLEVRRAVGRGFFLLGVTSAGRRAPCKPARGL